MRPIRLEMTAFGSYAEKTVLPFDQLRSGLYLVTGDTGAGKTTIFDAIVFALFGKASGTDRTADMMHCDYVAKSTDTEVTLEFSEGGKRFSVSRTIHFPKKRGAEDRYGDQQLSAILREPDRDPTEGPEKVSRRVEELLGMNAEQFRKIVMLAQGEFREFLRADSDKKNEILGKLFDNGVYLAYQELLGGARDELLKRRLAMREELGRLMEHGFRLPEGAEAERFLPDHPALTDNLCALIGDEEERCAEQSRRREETRRRVRELDGRYGAAQAVEAQFSAREEAARRLALLETRREEMARRGVALERAETAYQRVFPALEAFERSDRAMNEAQAEAELLRVTLGRCTKELEQARLLSGDAAGKKERIAALDAELGRLDDQILRLREREERRAALSLAKREAARAEAEKDALLKRCAALGRELEELRQRLASLEGAEALTLQRQADYEKACARRRDLTELREDCQAQLREESGLREQQELLSGATEAALAAEERYHGLYRRFLAGQAGLMAESLRRRIAETGEADCPVCGSRVTAEQEPRFAARCGELPGEEQVEQARRAAVEAEQRRNAQDKRTEALSARLRQNRNQLVTRAEKLVPAGGSWELLTQGGLLETAAREQEEQEKRLRSAYQEAQARETERARLRGLLPLREESLAQAQREADQKAALQLEQLTRAETLENWMREAGKELRYESLEQAQDAGQRLEREKEALGRELEENRKALELARSRRDQASGNLEAREKQTRRLAEEQAGALHALDETLAAYGFADPAELRDALRPAGDMEPASWLRKEQQELTAYQAACLHSEQELQRLNEQLSGRERTDPGALERERDQANALYLEADRACKELELLLQNHRDVHMRAKTLKSALDQSARAAERMNRLGDLAVGVTGEGGKLSFDRYVMGTVFREILELANRRLDLMSGGKYQLLHRSAAGRRNAKAGLEIQVLDMSTGLLREPDSLSGGETFFTSLALALGLSDAVQNRAGGRSLDALFIDEGFGSLSDDALDKALDVLGQLSAGERLVGIISHVDRLGESIPQKVRVKNGEGGSSLTLEPA